MRIKEIVSESPQFVGTTDFNLDDTANNKAFAARCITKVSEVIEKNNNYEISRTGDSYHGWMFLYVYATQTVEYVVQYERENFKWLAPTVTQCLLWRATASLYTKNLTQRMFFDYLLPRYGAIISDTQQTKDGYRFWGDRMSDAVSLGHFVGIADMRDHKVDWFDPSSASFREWFSIKPTLGKTERFKEIRYVISETRVEAVEKFSEPKKNQTV